MGLDEHRHSGLRQCPERHNTSDVSDIGHRFLQRVRLLSDRASLLLHGRYVSKIAASVPANQLGHSKRHIPGPGCCMKIDNRYIVSRRLVKVRGGRLVVDPGGDVHFQDVRRCAQLLDDPSRHDPGPPPHGRLRDDPHGGAPGHHGHDATATLPPKKPVEPCAVLPRGHRRHVLHGRGHGD